MWRQVHILNAANVADGALRLFHFVVRHPCVRYHVIGFLGQKAHFVGVVDRECRVQHREPVFLDAMLGPDFVFRNLSGWFEW